MAIGQTGLFFKQLKNFNLKTMDKYKGKELEFISRISRDGKGIIEMTEVDIHYLDDEKFELYSLSLTLKTHIACGFNIYVVKIN